MYLEDFSIRDILAWAKVAILAGLMVPVLLYLTRNTKKQRMINRIPGPPIVPFFGDAWELYVPPLEVLEGLWRIIARYPSMSVIRLWLGYRPVVLIRKGKPAEHLLREPQYVNKPDEYKISHRWLGLGILNSPREKWEKHRRVMNHTFHARILDSFVPIYNEQVEILIKNWKAKAGQGIFNAFPYVVHCTLDILCETTMGVKMRTQENYNCEYVEALLQMFKIFCIRVMRPWLRSDFVFGLTKLGKVEEESVRVLHGFAMNVITERRKLREKEKKDKINENEPSVFGAKRRLATLDQLLEAEVDGKPLSDKDILDEVQVVLVAGHETTASAISWTVFLLGHDPEVQRKAQKEIDSVLGETDRPVTLEDLPKLKYVEAIAKEGLRLFPTVPIFGRKTDEDIDIGGYTVPAQTGIFVVPFFIHRDPDVFPDPEKFDPERFLSDRTYTQYEYMPFSAGPRNCIGHRFAMMEMKVVLSRLMKNFNFASHEKREDIKYINGAVLHSLTGMQISVEKRNN